MGNREMSGAQLHRDLVVLQRSMDLVVQVYQLSDPFPKVEMYRFFVPFSLPRCLWVGSRDPVRQKNENPSSLPG